MNITQANYATAKAIHEATQSLYLAESAPEPGNTDAEWSASIALDEALRERLDMAGVNKDLRNAETQMISWGMSVARSMAIGNAKQLASLKALAADDSYAVRGKLIALTFRLNVAA